MKIYLKDVFAFAEYQEKAAYGLGHKLTSTTNTDNAVLNKDNAINNTKIKINAIEWYVLHFTPSTSNHAIIFRQILSKVPTELQYVERTVFLEEVNTQIFWTFELETQETFNITIWNIIGFQQQRNKEIGKIHRIQKVILFIDLQ